MQMPIPSGYEVEEIPGTPFEVVFEPPHWMHQDDFTFYAITCAGVDVSQHINSDVEEKALQVVLDAITQPERDAEDLKVMLHRDK